MLQLDHTRKAVRYRRVSSRSQKDNFSLRTQEIRSAQYCESIGLPIDRIFTDVGTGLTAKGRRGFTEMCDYVLDKTNGITDVVFNDIDRFTRNLGDFIEYTERMVKAGITLHIAIDAEVYDYYSAEKWTDRAVTAQKESRRISARTKGGQRTATELGYHIGAPPWGYNLKHESDEMDESGYHAICGKLVPDPKLWPHVLEFWRLATEGVTPLRLAQVMRWNNVPSPRGEEWSDDTTRRVMKNAKYCGRLFRGVNPKSRIPGPQENAAPIFLENNHQAAVSPENWQKVNDAIAGRHRSKGATRSHSSPNPLSDRTKCGHCATRGVTSNLEIQSQSGNTALRCSRKKKRGADYCTFKSVNLDRLLEAVRDRIIHHFLTPENLQSVIDGVNDVSRAMLDERQVQLAHISDRKSIVKTKIKNIDDVLKEAGTKATNLHTLLNDLDELEKERAALDNEGKQIGEATEEALLFVNDQAGIIETALDYKTWIDPEDTEAVRELFKVFVQEVQVFEPQQGSNDQQVDIYYDLRAFKAAGQDGSNTETIYIGKKKSVGVSTNKCGIGPFTGIDRGYSLISDVVDRLPRIRGDRPFVVGSSGSAYGVAPHSRG